MRKRPDQRSGRRSTSFLCDVRSTSSAERAALGGSALDEARPELGLERGDHSHLVGNLERSRLLVQVGLVAGREIEGHELSNDAVDGGGRRDLVALQIGADGHDHGARSLVLAAILGRGRAGERERQSDSCTHGDELFHLLSPCPQRTLG